MILKKNNDQNKKERKSAYCLNCNQQIDDANFCPNCGQENTHKRISTHHLFRDFFGDYFTFDSKFFHSLFPLLFKPGHLTSEYTRGRRQRYILPVRLYIFTTFIFFFVLTLNSKIDKSMMDEPIPKDKYEIARDSMIVVLDQNSATIPEQVRNDLLAIYDSQDDKDIVVFDDDDSVKVYNPYNGSFKKDWTSADKDSTGLAYKFEQYIEHKAEYLKSMGDQAGKQFLKEMINQVPKVMFVLLPIFALILTLLFIRHKIYYIEHLIFSLHVHTFFFFLLIFMLFWPHWITFVIIFILSQLYLFVAIRNFYQQKFWKAVLKFNLLLFLYTLCIIPAIVGLVLLALVSV